MKKLKKCSLLLACTVSSLAFAQNNTGTQAAPSKEKKVKITDASILGGFMSQNTTIAGSLTDFQKLNPQSAILMENMEGFTSQGYSYYYGYPYAMNYGSNLNAGGTFGASLGLSFKEKPKSVTQLRIGVAVSGTSFNNFVSKTDRVPYDTLTSSQTGQTVYYDSVTYRSYSMQYNARQLKLDVSLLYRMYPSARWSLYGGIGLQGGASLTAYSDITYSEYSVIEGKTSDYNYQDNVNRTERIINKNIQEVVAYLPVGVDFRLGKRKEFLKQIHLFTELRPFVSVLNIPELGTFSGTGFQNIMGLRVTL